MKTEKKIVIVTGASRGLGYALASKLADEGFIVIGTGRSAEIPKAWSVHDSERLVYRSLDLVNYQKHQEFINSIVKEYGPIYGLVNNAAVGLGGVLGTMHVRDIETIITTNITGTILLTKYASRSMLLGGGGRIVNISSIIGETGFNGLSVYGASKSALNGFTRSLARELGKAAITVNSVSPGYMKTDMSASIQEGDLERIIRRSPLNTLVEPVDVANIVSLLLSEAGRHITGANYTVDAGSTI